MGRHTLRLREATRARGFPSEIFVDTVDDDTADETVPVLSYAETAEPGDVLVYQFATASAMAPWLAGRSETLVVNYHNVTPPELMAPWDNHLALGQLRAQGDVRLLAPRTTLAVADSRYNEAHLTAVRIHPDGGGLPVGRAQQCRHHRRGRRAIAGSGRAAPRCALVGHRARLAQQGAREHHRGARRGPRPRRPRRDAAAHRQAGDRVLRRRTAALRGRARPRRGGAIRRPRERCHGCRGLRRRRCVGRDLRARGLLRSRRRGDGRRPAGGGVRPGGRARGARRSRGARLGQGPLRAGIGHRCPAARHPAPGRGDRSGPGAAGRAESAVRRRPLRRPAGPSRNAPRTPGRERHPPVRPDAAPRRRSRAAHAAPARRHGGARHPLAHLRGDGRPRDGSRDATLRALRRRGRKPGTCCSISSPRPRRSAPGWAPGPKSWS